MNIRELLKKVESVNKLNKELGFDDKIYLALSKKLYKTIYLHNKSNLIDITDYYIKELHHLIFSTKLIKIDNFIYKFDNINLDGFLVQIGVD